MWTGVIHFYLIHNLKNNIFDVYHHLDFGFTIANYAADIALLEKKLSNASLLEEDLNCPSV